MREVRLMLIYSVVILCFMEIADRKCVRACVRACACARARARVCVCVCVCVGVCVCVYEYNVCHLLQLVSNWL